MGDAERHIWRFFRAGGFDQVRLETDADWQRLGELDQKLWVALACPVAGLRIDTKTLSLIDTDKDGRIRAPELLAAVRWVCACLNHPAELNEGAAALPLASLREDTPEGKSVLACARQILGNLNKAGTPTITLEDTADTTRIFSETRFNGDGVVPVEATADPALRGVMADVIQLLGPQTDRSGKPGVNQEKVDAFFAAAKAYDAWWQSAQGDATVLPLGEATLAAAAATTAVRAKIEDYFARCRLAAFDARATLALNREEKEYLALGAKELNVSAAEIAGLPLARVEADRPLPLEDGLNPAWAAAMAQFHTKAVIPLLGNKSAIDEVEWSQLLARLAPFEAWWAAKKGALVEPLGAARVRELLAAPHEPTLTQLIAKDKALEGEANNIAAVDRLIRYYRDLGRLARNFVSFRDFYGRRDKAVFQEGTLYLDQRSCELCLRVQDAPRHALMAGLAGTYLAYCDCTRPASSEKMQIVAAFTDGDSDNLMVGRNGVFYDSLGRDWDATITKIVDNPISIRQAFWSPYKKAVRMVEEQIAKRAAAAEAAANEQLATAAKTVAEADRAAAMAAAEKAKAAAAGQRKIDVGAVAAMGVALGSIGTAISAVATGLISLPLWQLPLVVVCVVLLISSPSMIIAWLKLRKRNLGPILDANGWAVNAKARLNVPFGSSLTRLAVLPPGSQRDLVDPFAEKKSVWPTVLIGLAVLWVVYVVLSQLGYIDDWKKRLHPKDEKRTEQSGATNATAPKAATPAGPEAAK